MLEKLKTFIALAECGSYTEAARKLYCSQPSVSQHIKFLEKKYDARLVVRRHNRIELTAQGQILEEQAQKLLQLYAETERKMKFAGTERKPVTLFMSNYIAEHYYGDLFDARFPCCQQCPWQINGHCYKDLRENLIEGRAKFAIMPIYPADEQIQKSYRIDLLFREELYLVFGPEHPLAARKVIYARDLENLPVLITQSAYLQDLIQTALDQKEVGALYMQMTDFKIIQKALEQNTGVSFMPKRALSPGSKLICRSVSGMRIYRENGLVVDPSKELTNAEKEYCRHIKEKLSS